MKLKEHIEKFDKSLNDSKEGLPKSQLKKYLDKFDESLGEPEEQSAQPFSYKVNEKLSIIEPVEQLKSEIQNRDRIIENLKNETNQLKKQVSIAEKDKSEIAEELRKSKWLENKITLSTKKVYEDKVKSVINENVDSKIVPILTAVGRKKQGNQQLNFGKWLKIPENRYLYEVNKDIARGIFEDTNALIERKNEEVRGGGAIVEAAKNYFLSFTGDSHIPTRKGDLVHTDFNPDDFDLNLGFTISYWVRPDELGTDMFAIGRKAHNHERFTFGIARAHKGYFGVGANTSETRWSTYLDAAGMDKATHLTLNESDEWELTEGKWYHFAVTYANRVNDNSGTLRKIYMNGQQIWGTGVSDGEPNNAAGNINWSSTGREMSKGMSFGMRAVRGSGDSASYNNGWACGLDEVAIYDEEKEADWVADVYNGGTGYDHSDATKSDNDSTAKAAGTSQRGLVGYWKFNEGTGTRVEDLSGFGNHGLLTNDTYGDDGGAAWVDENDTPTWEVR